uniref:Uncharacterized protein n=1 Tax=Cyprinodon variegatus TaxID=28743 RepID=A0A3Q2EDU0_CYPVA
VKTFFTMFLHIYLQSIAAFLMFSDCFYLLVKVSFFTPPFFLCPQSEHFGHTRCVLCSEFEVYVCIFIAVLTALTHINNATQWCSPLCLLVFLKQEDEF